MPAPHATANFGRTHETLPLQVGGLGREYVVHVPASLSSEPRPPAVVMCHGGGGTAKTAAIATSLSHFADQREFVAIYPQATRKDPSQPVTFLRNPTFWNVGSGFGHAERLRIDDVGYVNALLDDAIPRFSLDPARIFVAGFSNGAALALRAAVDLSERFAGVCAVAGHLWDKQRVPARPTSLLYIIGTQDPVVPPAGGIVHSPWGKSHTLPPVIDTIDCWARWLDCPRAPIETQPSAGVRLSRFGPGERGCVVDYYQIDGAGHVWPGGLPVLAERIAGPSTLALDATQALCDFFALKPNPGGQTASD